MAKIAFKAGEEYAIKLAKFEKAADKIAAKALKAGAGVVADEIRRNIKAIPTEKPMYLGRVPPSPDHKLSGISDTNRQDLLDSLGITPMKIDREGNYNVKIGFDGYGSKPTAKYKNGLPNQLLARAVESGSIVREKHPFVRPAIKNTKRRAAITMGEVIDDETARIMGPTKTITK